MKRLQAVLVAVSAVACIAATPNRTIRGYLQDAAAFDLLEISEAKLALAHSQTPQVRNFARQVLDDHAAWDASLRTEARDSLKQELPAASLAPDQARLLDELRQTAPAAFDRTYVRQQVWILQGAVNLHQRFSSFGSDRHVQDLAGHITDEDERYLGTARKLQMSLLWGRPAPQTTG